MSLSQDPGAVCLPVDEGGHSRGEGRTPQCGTTRSAGGGASVAHRGPPGGRQWGHRGIWRAHCQGQRRRQTQVSCQTMKYIFLFLLLLCISLGVTNYFYF